MQTFSPGTDGARPAETLVSGLSGRIVIPDAASLFQGAYSRQASDLVIEGPDGNVIRIADYYHADETADLYSETGAVVSADVVDRLVGPQNPMVYAQAGTPAGQLQIGQVETLEGSAFATRANGQRVALAIGDPVFSDDLVETANDSKLGLTLIDETVFSLSADARMIMDELVYEPNGANNSMLVNLVQGTFVFITGQIAPTGNMRIETPVVTVGIRGTTPIMIIEGLNGNSVFGILKDPDGTVGQYAIFDKLTGLVIERIVDESMIVQIDRVGGDPTPVTLDAAGLAARAEAQSSAYFVYSAARSRIDSRQQNDQPTDENQNDGTGDTPGDRSQIDGNLGPDALSSGLNGFQLAFGENGLGSDPLDLPPHPFSPTFGSPPVMSPPVIGFGPHTFIDPDNAPTIAPMVNNAPVATPITITTTDEDANSFTFDLLSTAFDPDSGDDLDTQNVTATASNLAQSVSFAVNNETGQLTFDPRQFNNLAAGQSTTVTFDYTIIDSNGATVANTAQLTINGRNDHPIANDDGKSGNYMVMPGNSITIPVSELLANDSDPDNGDSFDLTSIFNPTNGTATLNTGPSPSVTFMAAESLSGGTVVGFQYEIKDSSGASGFATVDIIIDDMFT